MKSKNHYWDKECPACLRVDAALEDLRGCLHDIKAALGDRLLAEGPLSKEYAHAIMQKIDEVLK